MSVQHQLRVVAVQQDRKRCKPTVRQIGQIAVAVHRRMGHKNIKPAVAVDLAAQAVDPLFHLGFGKLPGTGAVAAAAAQPGDAQPVVNIDIIINADDALRRAQVIAFIMVAVDIQHRHGGHRCQIFQIMAVQIAAGNDQINARELVRCEIVPQGFAFLIGDS